MGTGKSTLATELAETFDIDVLSTDHIRHEMLGSSKVPAAYGKGYYEPDMRIRVYDELLRQAGERLKEQQSVLLDGTFLTVGLRDRVYALSYRHNAVPLLVQCKCPRQTAYARIQQRAAAGQSESEARTELYDLQARDIEPPWADEPFVVSDTSQTTSKQLDLVCAELRRARSRKSCADYRTRKRQCVPWSCRDLCRF